MKSYCLLDPIVPRARCVGTLGIVPRCAEREFGDEVRLALRLKRLHAGTSGRPKIQGSKNEIPRREIRRD